METETDFSLTVTRVIPDIAGQPAVLLPEPPRSPIHFPQVVNRTVSIEPDNIDFRFGGACKGVDPDIFFRPRDEDIAKGYCRHCPVTRECLAFAMQPDTSYSSMAMFGVYGGLNEDERADLRRSRQLQRPNVA
jgi:WhiB family transcriptional regulator, redox-sensing transcriptional regulator